MQLQTEIPDVIEVMEILMPLPGSMGRRLVEVRLPLAYAKHALRGKGCRLAFVGDLHGTKGATIRSTPEAVDEIVGGLTAAGRAYAKA